MRDDSQTLIALLRKYVNLWRVREKASRDTIALAIVAAHEAMNGPAITGICFDPPSGDPYTRAKVMGDRIFRWLDDETKEVNFLPANFIPSVLAALPFDLRLSCINELIYPYNLMAGGCDMAAEGEIDVLLHLAQVTKESAEAAVALTHVAVNPSLEIMETAARELDEAIEAKNRARLAVRKVINHLRGASGRVVAAVLSRRRG